MTSEDREIVREIIIDFLQENGSQVGSQKVVDLTVAEMTDENLTALIIPSVRPATGEWVQTTLKTMMRPINNGVTNLNTIKSETIAAKDAAVIATNAAENVNAVLSGMTVTITDRTGTSRSVNIGFGIYRTYPSIASMNADADNVPEGRFVIIATTDATSEDNAKMYAKNSAGSFTFLCDLDQASAKAYADWMENTKPLILQSIQDANDAAANANDKAALAETAATNADNSRLAIEQKEGARQTAEASRVSAEASRATAETTRQTNETARQTSEGSRQTAEGARATAEQTRQSNETTRGNNETTRQTAESERATAESTRNDNETARQTAEETRNDNETTRQSNETSRQQNEQARYNNEQTRITNEGVRQTNETERVNAENDRKTAWNNWFSDTLTTGVRYIWNTWFTATKNAWKNIKEDAQTAHQTAASDHDIATQDHQTAASDHSVADSDHMASVSATSDANNAATLANEKAGIADTSAQNADEKAQYAEEQGDYAKEWNDHPPYIADGTIEHPGDMYYMYLWDINTHAYVRGAYVKGADIDYSTMTAEEYQRLVENVKESVLFASVQICEDIIDELT